MSAAPNPFPVRVLIADDEPLAINSLAAILASDPDILIVGRCQDGRSALERLRLGEIDVALLDLQMPDLSGLEIVRAVDPRCMPLIVFVTAYDEYAVEAFEASAIDYVLKPVRAERLQKALDRCKNRIWQESAVQWAARITDLFGEDAPVHGKGDAAVGNDRLIVRSCGRTILLDPACIDWIEAADYCARIHAGDHEYIIRESMMSLERRLPARKFVRTHRSCILNVDRIDEIRPTPHGDYDVFLCDGTRARLSRTRRAEIENRLGRRL